MNNIGAWLWGCRFFPYFLRVRLSVRWHPESCVWKCNISRNRALLKLRTLGLICEKVSSGSNAARQTSWGAWKLISEQNSAAAYLYRVKGKRRYEQLPALLHFRSLREWSSLPLDARLRAWRLSRAKLAFSQWGNGAASKCPNEHALGLSVFSFWTEHCTLCSINVNRGIQTTFWSVNLPGGTKG